MGRHSAPDTGFESAGSEPAASATESTGPVLTMPSRPGRHAHSDGSGSTVAAEAPTDEQPAVDAALADEPAGPGPLDLLIPPDAPAGAATSSSDPAAAEKPARGRGTAADLALVRRHPAVRARVIGGALVPFVVYAAVLAAVGATLRQGLLWIFIPLVVAGVLVGVFLDMGHKRHAGAPPDDTGAADETGPPPPAGG